MKISATFFFLMTYSVLSHCQENFISFEKTNYRSGDTIPITCNIPSYKSDSVHFATLYVWIENIVTHKKWTYRYPIVDGLSAPSLLADSAIRDGKYAFNFFVRKQFFSIRGNAEKSTNTIINYSMLTKNNSSFFDNVRTDANGYFSVKGLLYEDTCYFVFLANDAGGRTPTIRITTALDSLFVPDMSYTRIITIGQPVTIAGKDTVYEADIEQLYKQSLNTLPDVQVYTKQKKKVEQFDAEYSTGLFQNSNARVFDGLEDRRIAESQSVIQFLQGRVGGLHVSKQSNGNYILQWRGQGSFRNQSNVDVYVDEFRLSTITDDIIVPSDVAMIKVYPPPAFLSPGGQNGAIAIYTKRGDANNASTNKNKFKVFGYSALQTVWK